MALTAAPAPGPGTRKPRRVPGSGPRAVCRGGVRWRPRAAHGPLLLHSHIQQDDRQGLLGSGDAVRVSHRRPCVCRPQCPGCACSSVSHPGASVLCSESVLSREVTSKEGPRAAVTPGHGEDTHLSHETINEGTHLCHGRPPARGAHASQEGMGRALRPHTAPPDTSCLHPGPEPRGRKVQKEGKISYADFVWFLISEEDKKTPTRYGRRPGSPGAAGQHGLVVTLEQGRHLETILGEVRPGQRAQRACGPASPGRLT